MNKDEIFQITGVSRSDLESIGFNTDTLTDKDMEAIASKLCDFYLEYGSFWQDLENIAIDIYELKKSDM